ncbi:MAG: hypothetical protein KDE25_02855 [Novosphingobium sp.]|nr:hypothetical protein [Novosphingobium sp.]
MLIRVLNALRTHAAEIFAAGAIAWVVLLVLVDLGGTLLPTSNTPRLPDQEESLPEPVETPAAKPDQTGCVDVGGVSVCD